jgi:hypothetical protein
MTRIATALLTVALTTVSANALVYSFTIDANGGWHFCTHPSCQYAREPLPYDDPANLMLPPHMTQDQEREAIISQGEDFCRRYPHDRVCHPPKDALRDPH